MLEQLKVGESRYLYASTHPGDVLPRMVVERAHKLAPQLLNRVQHVNLLEPPFGGKIYLLFEPDAHWYFDDAGKFLGHEGVTEDGDLATRLASWSLDGKACKTKSIWSQR